MDCYWIFRVYFTEKFIGHLKYFILESSVEIVIALDSQEGSLAKIPDAVEGIDIVGYF
jgi:hypothetical protein